jgi:hypothetical protein
MTIGKPVCDKPNIKVKHVPSKYFHDITYASDEYDRLRYIERFEKMYQRA